ncbi:MAG: DUF1080 domain-containing protein [Candidatus Poribacteria bacterium]|nr:DUF1080 domain-containing protein [Candidatus Poribacteria bacterium]
MRFAILMIGGILLFQTLPVSAGTFLETFDNFNLKDWEEVSERNAPAGEWRDLNGELHAESKDNAIRMLVIKDAAWHDYEVELDVMPLVRHGRGHIVIAARVNQTYAVIFAIGNIFWNTPSPIVSGVVLNLPMGQIVGLPLFFPRIDKFFKMELAELNEVFNRLAREEVQEEILKEGASMNCTTVLPRSFLKTREWSHLKLRVDQERFTLSVNGEDVLSFTCLFDNFAFLEEDLNVGSVGFGLAGYTARFDNLKITGEDVPNHGNLSVQPQGKLTGTWGQIKSEQ